MGRFFAAGVGSVAAVSMYSAALDTSLYGVPWTGTVSGGQGIISNQRGVPYRKEIKAFLDGQIKKSLLFSAVAGFLVLASIALVWAGMGEAGGKWTAPGLIVTLISVAIMVKYAMNCFPPPRNPYGPEEYTGNEKSRRYSCG